MRHEKSLVLETEALNNRDLHVCTADDSIRTFSICRTCVGGRGAWRQLTRANLCYSSRHKHDNYWKVGEREEEEEGDSGGEGEERGRVLALLHAGNKLGHLATSQQSGSRVNSEFQQS